MKKIITLLLTLTATMFMLSACGSDTTSSNNEQKADTLTVAMELAYPPFETKDEAGNPTGISVDFATAFADYVGMDVEIVNTAWDGLIPSLQTNKADMVISSMTITDERSKIVDFSDPYANSLLAILANKNSQIQTIEDLNQNGKKVAVKTGSTGYLYATNNLQNAEIIALADESACVTEVSQGKADAFLYDQLTIYRNQQKFADTTEAIFIPFQNPEKWGVAVKKGNTELMDKLNQFIAEYTTNGGFNDLTEKYLNEEKQAFDQLNFQWFFDLD